MTEMKLALRRGEIFSHPEEYIARMSRNYTFVDNLFLKFFATLVGHDIVVLPVHPESASINREFTWIFGTNTFCSSQPILNLYFRRFTS